MLVGPGGEAVGSVSGGCVEGAVYELAQGVVADGAPALQRYGVSDDDAYAVGLTCGGILDVFVEPVSRQTFPELEEVAADIEAGRPVAVATVIEHPDPAWRRSPPRRTPRGRCSGGGSTGSLGSPRADDAVTDDARGLLASGAPRPSPTAPTASAAARACGSSCRPSRPSPRMLVFGAIDFAAAVAHQGHFLGYHVTVCDARPVFATRSRFPSADEVVVTWPHRYLEAERDAGRVDARTVICVLTHDPKFDVPVLEVALRLPEVGYVGAMGSRRTHDDRMARLREAGLTDAELSRLSSPVGLDLGARTPEETAVSIAAEIIALQWGGRGERLGHRDGPIHHHAPGLVAATSGPEEATGNHPD